MNDLPSQIRNQITDQVTDARTNTQYRSPLVAFARADDPRFQDVRRLIPDHQLPADLLPGAQSICAFFVPFAKPIITSNRRGEWASPEWAQAYVETNALIAETCDALVGELARQGIGAAWAPPTHNFDPHRLISTWSHKSVAFIAGLGQFGHHQMLITPTGCAGRLGSLVLDVALPPSPAADHTTLCTFEQGCRACIRRCPVGALTEQGLDRKRCYARCLENDARFDGWLADVCGKCVTGPCAIDRSPTLNREDRKPK